MARKTKEDAAQTRRALLDGALEVFSEKGFGRATQEDIASRAGVTRGAFYWHFKDKVSLLLELAHEMAEEVESALRPWEEGAVISLEGFRVYLRTFLRCLDANRRYRAFFEVAYLRTEWMEELRPLRDWERAYDDANRRELEEALTSLRERGAIRRDLEIAPAALAVSAMLEGILTLWLEGGERFTLEEDGMRCLDVLLAGFRPRE